MSLNERKALLSKSNSPELQNHVAQLPQKHAIGSSSSEEWSSSYSSRSSMSGGSDSDDSYAPDWEEFVQDDGRLFYIEYQNILSTSNSSKPQSQANENSLNAARNELNRASTRRSKKSGSKLSKLINRNLKGSAGAVGGKGKSPVKAVLSLSDSTKVKFSEISEGEIKEIKVLVDPSMRHKFGRRASVAEAILGLSICSFPDGNRIMIAGYMPNSHLSQDKFVKIGDWLKAINDDEVSMKNIDLVLMGFGQPTEIKLTLQRMSGEIEPIPSLNSQFPKITSFWEFVDQAAELLGDGSNGNEHANNEMCFSVMYLTMAGLEENGPEGQDVLFCYPEKEKNYLYTSRGSFLTLNSLLGSIYSACPLVTTVQFNDTDYYVTYKGFDEDLLLIAISSKYATVQETKLKTTEIIRCMEYLHQTVTTAIVNTTQWTYAFSMISQIYLRNKKNTVSFECALLEPHYVPLPKEAQLRIDDALGEMEAMDYREWNDEPLKSHREFYILGSALYYKSYLLASHLPPSDLLDIESFLRVHGLNNLIATQSLRDLVIWQEVYPKSVERGLVQQDSIYGIPKGRWFLAIVARYHMMLAVLLESRHDNSSDEQFFISPSPFYIEEIQDTLEHLRTGGIENLASTWVNSNKRPQVIRSKEEPSEVENTLSPVAQPKKTEIISILKRRTNSIENVNASGPSSSNNNPDGFPKLVTTSIGGSSVNSQTFSEDSNHDGSDSDWDGFPDSQQSSSGFDMSDLTETLLKEVSDVIPSKLTAGTENVLFHYVQVEVGEGILLAPTGLTSNENVISAFRRASLLIHTVLQNTIRFRYLLSQESSKPNSHRSLVAIKEHGILISVDGDTDDSRTEFWVIGRLFSLPPKELYVCHRADIPQNLVEIAFRLSMNSAG